jgi:multidrug efflux pump subunit AcrA (membrane-fusion protein)
MERIEYDPEIDPTIREEREKAEKERELSARIRLEIDRYVADNDLVPREKTDSELPPPWDDDAPPPWEMGSAMPLGGANDPGTESGEDEELSPREQRRREREQRDAEREEQQAQRQAAKEAAKEERAARAAGRRRAVQSVFTGSILQSDRVRRMWPYMLGIAAVLVLYIGYNFHVAGLHLYRQRLEKEVRELGIEAVERTAERVRQTRRSAIVERLKEKNIPLEEFPNPVKRIEK